MNWLAYCVGTTANSGFNTIHNGIVEWETIINEVMNAVAEWADVAKKFKVTKASSEKISKAMQVIAIRL